MAARTRTIVLRYRRLGLEMFVAIAPDGVRGPAAWSEPGARSALSLQQRRAVAVRSHEGT